MLYFYLKMHQNAFGGRTPPAPTGGAYGAPPDPLAGLKGEGSKEGAKGGRGRWKERGRTPNV